MSDGLNFTFNKSTDTPLVLICGDERIEIRLIKNRTINVNADKDAVKIIFPKRMEVEDVIG